MERLLLTFLSNPQLLVQKVGFFIKDVREDDAHDDDVSDRKKQKLLS